MLLILVFAALVVAYFYFKSPSVKGKSPSVKGAMGEARVSSWLQGSLDPEKYIILNDLMLPIADGTTQIDHVVVSEFGVFVIETKNMKGWIFGGERQARWTQIFWRHKSQFQNPLRQNFKHGKAVQELLSLPMSSIHNVVAFVGVAEPKTDMPPNVLWSARELAVYIRSKTTTVLTLEQAKDMALILRDAALELTKQAKQEHIQALKQREDQRRNSTGCPRCGDEMVERTNKKTGNKFLGCSRFPKCRGTRKVPFRVFLT